MEIVARTLAEPGALGYARLADLFFQAIQSALEVR